MTQIDHPADPKPRSARKWLVIGLMVYLFMCAGGLLVMLSFEPDPGSLGELSRRQMLVVFFIACPAFYLVGALFELSLEHLLRWLGRFFGSRKL